MMFNDEYLMNPCSHGETGVCIQCIIQEDPDLDQIPGGIENEKPNTTEEQGPAQEIRSWPSARSRRCWQEGWSLPTTS